MDPKAIGDAVGAAVTYALSSPACMLAAGVAAGNTKTLIHGALLGVAKVPVLRQAVFGSPEETKAKLAEIVAEADADIDEIAKAQAAKVPAAPPPADPKPEAPKPA